ncbi:MAG: hypothetical protein C4527_26025 [Candidatus Omnitrophota bacterium]|jgi:UTP-glucose-1-phosphate uridylyltransferase|nr:MAG: hypothetical protein C4527_26025 [Candidatus Omnitrophota bacterium]
MAVFEDTLEFEFVKTVYPEFWKTLRDSPGFSFSQRKNTAIARDEWRLLPEEPVDPIDQFHVISALPRTNVSTSPEKPVVVILAGGKGSRMICNEGQKVLCPICGVPALLRAVRMYRNFGITEFVVVVGIGYKRVIDCLWGEQLRISFLFQEEPAGTGHAGRLAARYLKYQGYAGDVLVAMGDKFMSRRALEKLFQDHAQSGADLTLSAASKSAWPDAGRVMRDETGQVRAILEKPDIVLMRLLYDFRMWEVDPVPCDAFLAHALACWNRPGKLRKIFGELFWNQLHEQKWVLKKNAPLPFPDSDLRFQIADNLNLLGEEVENVCSLVNLSVYLFKAAALYESVENLRANNAQNELYLTDAAHYLTSNTNECRFRVHASPMPDDNDVMGFNTQEELETIERRVQEKNLLDE